MKQEWINWFKLDKKNMKIFISLVGMYVFYVLPIILADRYYNDDLGRSVTGGAGWNGDGRPLTEKLLYFLCGGEKIVDISPLPLLLGIVILGYALTIYARENLVEVKSDYVKVFALFLAITSPFMLTNLSYKYDCVSMLFALSLSFFVYSLPQKLHKGLVFGVSFVFSVCSLSMYQPAIGAFLCLALIGILFLLLFSKGDFIEECVKVLGIGSGCVFYKLVVANIYISKEDWRYGASSFLRDISKESLIKIYNHFEMLVVESLKEYIVDSPKYILIILAIIYVMSSAIMIKQNIENNKEKLWKIAGSIYIVFLPVFLLLAAVLPLMILETSSRKYRMLISFSILLLYLGIMACFLAKKSRVLVTVLLVSYMLFSYTYAYIYGNALDGQKEYEKYLIYNIQHDIEEINCNREFDSISISGSTPYAPQVRAISSRYGLIDNMIEPYISNTSWIGGGWVYIYMNDRLDLREPTEADQVIISSNESVRSNSVYSCYVNDKTIIVHFNKPDE